MYLNNFMMFSILVVPVNVAQAMLISQIIDAVLIFFLLLCWAAAVYAFYLQWSSFHVQLPHKYTGYKNLPKGLENIKVRLAL